MNFFNNKKYYFIIGLIILFSGIWINKGYAESAKDYVNVSLNRVDLDIMSVVKATITRRPTATETYTPTLRPTFTKKPLTATLTKTIKPTWTIAPTQTAIPTLTRKPTVIITKWVTPTYTRQPRATDTPLPSPTNTRNPTATEMPTKTPTATVFVVTPTLSPTPTITPTPDVRGLTIPNPDNFERIIQHLAISINYVSVMQEGSNHVDVTDLVEDFLDFSRSKYEEYVNGKRPYKYLNFQEFRRGDLVSGKLVTRAVVVVPDSQDGKYDKEYLDQILRYMKDDLKVDVSKINDQQRVIIARDIGESNRFTCVKFLRLVWNLFGDYYHDGKGLFPEIYQARIVFAGQLAFQAQGGGNIFSQENQGILKISRIKNAMIIAENPMNRPDLFANKVVVFFRAQSSEFESGHVGVAKLIPEYNDNNELVNFLVTFIEVDGNTGQAYYAYRLPIEDFRNHLYMENRDYAASRRPIGWLFNREN